VRRVPFEQEPGVVDFDAGAAQAAARSAIDEDAVRVCVEFDRDAYRVLYAADDAVEEYGGVEPMLEQFDRIHGYVHLDLTERELFTDLFQAVGAVRYTATAMDRLTLVRMYAGNEGMLLSLRPRCPIEPVAEAVADALD
jgi:hypothetical protein